MRPLQRPFWTATVLCCIALLAPGTSAADKETHCAETTADEFGVAAHCQEAVAAAEFDVARTVSVLTETSDNGELPPSRPTHLTGRIGGGWRIPPIDDLQLTAAIVARGVYGAALNRDGERQTQVSGHLESVEPGIRWTALNAPKSHQIDVFSSLIVPASLWRTTGGDQDLVGGISSGGVLGGGLASFHDYYFRPRSPTARLGTQAIAYLTDRNLVSAELQTEIALTPVAAATSDREARMVRPGVAASYRRVHDDHWSSGLAARVQTAHAAGIGENANTEMLSHRGSLYGFSAYELASSDWQLNGQLGIHWLQHPRLGIGSDEQPVSLRLGAAVSVQRTFP